MTDSPDIVARARGRLVTCGLASMAGTILTITGSMATLIARGHWLTLSWMIAGCALTVGAALVATVVLVRARSALRDTP